MCDCEDLVPAQELKGTSLPSPVVDSWDKEDKKQRAEFVREKKRSQVSTLEDCAFQNCHMTHFVFLPQDVLQLFLPKKSKAEMFNEQSSYFWFFCSVFNFFFYMRNIS